MKRLLAVLALITACAVPPASAAEPMTMCDSDPVFRRLVLDAALRYSASGSHRLPKVSATEVAVVTDDSVCTAAAEARRLQRGEGSSGVLLPVTLVQVGTTHYVLFDTILTSTGQMDLIVTDTAFMPLVRLPH